MNVLSVHNTLRYLLHSMEKGDRQRVQLAWLNGDVKVICATIA